MVLFALVFFATRWYLYPLHLVDPCRDNWLRDHAADWTRASPDVWFQPLSNGIILGGFHVSFYGLAMLLLYALYGLHIFWGGFILKMAWKMLVQRKGKTDENSDDEEDQQIAMATTTTKSKTE
jgi:hypothetical protein